MAKHSQGRFVVSETDDGRFVAASASAPFFCFRADTEEEVLAKVKRAVTFSQSQTVDGANIVIRASSQTITSVGGRSYNVDDLLEAA